MKKEKIIIFFVLIIMVFLPPFNSGLDINFEDQVRLEKQNIIENQNYSENQLKSSDIAGTDLYAEKISSFVAGRNSLIKMSLFTNDTNILSQFDSKDPAFYKCNVLISASNGKNPSIFPIVLTESEIPSHYRVGYNSFVGFLYYDKDVEPDDAQLRAQRALEIIKRKFMIDLIMVNVSEPNFFPFVGHYPNWEFFFNELTKNFPMDGYWKALNISRLTSQDYLENQHISSTFMLINSLDFFEGDFNITTDQLNFNLESLDLSFLENLEIEDLINQSAALIESFGEVFNTTTSEGDLEQFIDIFNTFSLTNNSHYSAISIQYEGLNEGIQKIGKNQYKFDLWRALGYEGDPLAPSEKIYIALVGAFMSSIEVNILCSDIIDMTPLNFEFYDYLLEQVSLLFFLAGTEFDVQQIEDYSFDLFWLNEEGIKRSYVKPVNLQDPADVINLLPQLGFQGFSSIPTGIVNPFGEFTVTYNISNSEPNLLLKKELIGENASYGVFRNFEYNISVENVGNITAWGIPTSIPLELNDFFLLLTLGSQELADEFQDTIWEIVDIEYPNQYDSLEDFFNFDEDPQIFYFDTLGTGTYDSFYPDLLNFTNLWPYNENMDNIIDIIISGYPQLISALLVIGLTPSDLKDLFTNSFSVWNANNWYLEPEKVISIQVSNVSIANIDSFSSFYLNNFTIDPAQPLPEMISGTSLSETTPEMALSTDNISWIIGSEEQFLEQRIEINFIFKNDTKIDLVNNPLENVSIIINFTAPDDLDTLNFEIFNFSIEEYQDMGPYLESITNNSWIFSFINNNESLDWLFYEEDYTLLFKVLCLDSEQFNISINNLDLELATRDINFNEDTGSRVLYGSSTKNVQFERRSNSIPLSTYDAASIVAYSYLTNYSSIPGESNTYNIYFKNIGSNIAENVSISLLVPGIIKNTKDFTLQESNLTYFLPKLAPLEEKTISFSFYIPNSISLKDVSISYQNPENIEGGNSSKLYSLINEVNIYAPVDYEEFFPFLRTIEIAYESNSNSINYSPDIGDIFNLRIYLKNNGPKEVKIPDINISMNDQYGDLKRINNITISFEDINFNETVSSIITLIKLGWKGYYYPPINYITGSESRTIQISTSLYEILGQINFSIKKSVKENQLEINDYVIVRIEVENTGTIIINNIKINDMRSYSQSDFSLIEGKLVNIIDSLEPGVKASVNYTIKAKKRGFVNLKPASIIFYYLLKNEEKSNNVDIKIITPKYMQFSYIIFPIFSVFIILIVYYRLIKNYKKKKSEFQRNEKFIFELSSRESILKIEHTLRESLNTLSKRFKEENSIEIIEK